MKKSNSPTPWKYNAKTKNIEDKNGTMIAVMRFMGGDDSEGIANGKLLVKAVNKLLTAN